MCVDCDEETWKESNLVSKRELHHLKEAQSAVIIKVISYDRLNTIQVDTIQQILSSKDYPLELIEPRNLSG